MTFSEHLVGFLLDLCAALLAAWFFSTYSSRISDYWARRSEAMSRARASHLKDSLKNYENDYSDAKIFIIRILGDGVKLILWFIMVNITIIVWLDFVTLSTIACKLEHKCSEIFWMKLAIGAAFTIVITLAYFMFLMAFWRFRLESVPSRYRSVMEKRISRLLDRLP